MSHSVSNWCAQSWPRKTRALRISVREESFRGLVLGILPSYRSVCSPRTKKVKRGQYRLCLRFKLWWGQRRAQLILSTFSGYTLSFRYIPASWQITMGPSKPNTLSFSRISFSSPLPCEDDFHEPFCAPWPCLRPPWARRSYRSHTGWSVSLGQGHWPATLSLDKGFTSVLLPGVLWHDT